MRAKTKEFTFTDRIEIMLALTVLCNGYGSQKRTAEALGISPQYLHDILSGKREITARVAAHFGVKPLLIWVPIKEG